MTSYLPTSYFSEPSQELDPKLFQGRALRSWVRQGINHLLSDFFAKKYRHAELWSHPWLAGSGVSYQWSAARQPGDLDCLVGVDFVQFRQANPAYRGLTDKEISQQLNEEFRSGLQPTTENWNGYELTFYVNPRATDITSIKPYAAYDLKYDEWTVTPDPNRTPPVNPDWEAVASSDYATTQTAYTRATKAIQDLEGLHPGPQRKNAEATLLATYQQANALHQQIHDNRSEAFGPQGQGYDDFYNYRWQAAKRNGTLEMLHEISHAAKSRVSTDTRTLYGVDLPSADVMVRRAALYRAGE